MKIVLNDSGWQPATMKMREQKRLMNTRESEKAGKHQNYNEETLLNEQEEDSRTRRGRKSLLLLSQLIVSYS